MESAQSKLKRKFNKKSLRWWSLAIVVAIVLIVTLCTLYGELFPGKTGYTDGGSFWNFNSKTKLPLGGANNNIDMQQKNFFK